MSGSKSETTFSMESTLREAHDALLAVMPDGAEHAGASCRFCVETANQPKEESMSEKTYSEADYAKLQGEVSELTAKVAELTKASEESELESRFSEEKAELEAQVADLQGKLDASVLDAENARTELTNIVSYLEAEDAAATELAAAEARKEERVDRVKEVANFPEEYLTENADRFAAMADEDFEKALEDWSKIAPKPEGETKAPETAMESTRKPANENASLLRDVLGVRNRGVDIRRI